MRSIVLSLVAALASLAPLRPDGVWPLDPRPQVAEGFAPPAQRWDAGHRGVDLYGRAGQPVRAARAGTVTFAGALAGRGVVVVDHGFARSTYEPVAVAVRRGERVAAGAVLGTLQVPGSHCWPRACLHWGLRAGDRYLDPLGLVGGAPVRLLPLRSPLPAPGPRVGGVPALPAPALLPDPPGVGWLLPPAGEPATPWAASPRPGGELAGRPGGAGLW